MIALKGEGLEQEIVDKKVGDLAEFITFNNNYKVQLGEQPQNVSKPYLGVMIYQDKIIK